MRRWRRIMRRWRRIARLAAAESDPVLVFGHTHKPWVHEYGGVLFVNCGSVGKPKDGDPRGAGRRLLLHELRQLCQPRDHRRAHVLQHLRRHRARV